MQIKTALQAMRLPFLILTPACVFLGLSTSISYTPSIDFTTIALILVGAIAAHISVNTLNEYYDFKSGLDLKTEKTPFSGGSGALPEYPEAAGVILAIGMVSLMVTAIIGVYFILTQGTQILPIGIVGVVLIITYTQWLNRSPLLCLIAPGLGFGVLMIVGTHMVLSGEHSQSPWLISLIPFFLINNLLLLNQYPDIKADASVGRNTFPIVFGLKKSNLIYAVFMLSAYLLIPVFIIEGYLPNLSMIALTPIVFSLFSLIGAVKHSSKIAAFPQYLGTNVAAAILTPLILAVSIVYG